MDVLKSVKDNKIDDTHCTILEAFARLNFATLDFTDGRDSEIRLLLVCITIARSDLRAID